MMHNTYLGGTTRWRIRTMPTSIHAYDQNNDSLIGLHHEWATLIENVIPHLTDEALDSLTVLLTAVQGERHPEPPLIHRLAGPKVEQRCTCGFVGTPAGLKWHIDKAEPPEPNHAEVRDEDGAL